MPVFSAHVQRGPSLVAAKCSLDVRPVCERDSVEDAWNAISEQYFEAP